MRIDFQDDIMRFITQSAEGRKYVPLLDKDCFDLPTNQVIFDMVVEFIKRYKKSPSKIGLLEFFDKSAKKTKDLSDDVYKAIEKQIYKLYDTAAEDAGLIRDSIKEYSKRVRTKALFREKAELINSGDDAFFHEMYKEMSYIVDIGKEITEESIDAGSLIQSTQKSEDYDIEGAPTFLKDLNAMTTAGGFYSPQLVVLMGAPKSFKTGTMIKLALEYARDGYKVYYADTENGKKAIKSRAIQGMMESERHELRKLKEETKDMGMRFGVMGGDIRFGFYPANSKTLDDVDVELERLREEKGWVPDIIFYDYLDLFKSSNSRISEKRLVIQDVYHHAVRLNNKWGCFCFTVSTVNKNAVNKEVINMKDFGEDFQKAYNCHAAFAICRTEEEMELGFARIIPVLQRDGTPYRGNLTCCTVKIEEARMLIEEVRMEDVGVEAKRDKSITDD